MPTVAVPTIALPTIALPAVAVPTIALPTIAAPFQPRELVTERKNPLPVVLAAWLANGFANLALEPGVEPTVDLPLCVHVSTGGGLLPTFADPNDLFEVLPLIEVGTTREVSGLGGVVNRPSLVVHSP